MFVLRLARRNKVCYFTGFKDGVSVCEEKSSAKVFKTFSGASAMELVLFKELRMPFNAVPLPSQNQEKELYGKEGSNEFAGIQKG